MLTTMFVLLSWKLLLEWYACNQMVCSRIDAALIKGNSRCNQMVIRSFRSGHLCVQRHLLIIKVFPPGPKCNKTHAASKHLLTCIGCLKNQLFFSPDGILTKLKYHGSIGLDLDVPV